MPEGAAMDAKKTEREGGRSKFQVLPSVCALDCPDACALKLTVDQGRVVKLEGDPAHPITRGFACVKMVHYPSRQEHPDRLLRPMKRQGPKGAGKFLPIDWEEALTIIADRTRTILAEHGPQTILPYCYAGTMGLTEGSHALTLFRALGTLELDQTICATTGSAGWEANYGPDKLGPALEDLVHARFIILWGINLVRSHSHAIPFLKEAKRRGAYVLHIDPYRNETSRLADEHWPIQVGTDAALALAFGREILARGWNDESYLQQHALGLEEYRREVEAWTLPRAARVCGLDELRLRSAIEAYARTASRFIRLGYGMTRNEGGGNAVRAISLLPALTGAWKDRGGGALLSTSGAFQLARTFLGGRHLRRPQRRHVNMNCLASELLRAEEPIRGLFVFNSNPAAVAPDSSRVRRGLAREDLFTVVLEHFQTDTADYADILLPATTFLEHPDLYTAYGHYYLQWAEAVVKPRGEARSNTQIFADLGRRLGVTEPTLAWTAQEVAQALLDSQHPWLAGITWERLRRERFVRLALPDNFRPYAEGSHFPDRKVRFAPAPRQLVFEEAPTPEYPLRLISPPGAFVLNTTLGNIAPLLKAAGGQPQVIIHPQDAAAVALSVSGMVRLNSRYGSIVRQAVVSDQTIAGVVIAVGQWWPKLAPDRKSLNDLTSERLTDLGGGSTFGNVVVRIEPVPWSGNSEAETSPFP
jgi:anaerobic selenocysteine-containing dehydrogenase